MDHETAADYKRKGFAVRAGFGHRPALLVVDFIRGFTDPSTPLGGELAREIAASNEVLAAFRSHGLPVVFTTIAYEADFRDAGRWIEKVPSLSILVKGSPMVEIDSRIQPHPGEQVVRKQFASAFFGTQLEQYLQARGVDTVVLVGCTTSGCIRATAVDSMQYGFRTIVVLEAVGDRAVGPHEANLFDIDAKYGDVTSQREVIEYLGSISRGGLGPQANDDFQQWWTNGGSSP